MSSAAIQQARRRRAANSESVNTFAAALDDTDRQVAELERLLGVG
jgi:hypothetical protein